MEWYIKSKFNLFLGLSFLIESDRDQAPLPISIVGGGAWSVSKLYSCHTSSP